MKHKIQLVKEVNAKGETWFFIEKDGIYVGSTMTMNFQDAVQHYNNVANAIPEREILMEAEIDY